jgi:hypothetical protein
MSYIEQTRKEIIEAYVFLRTNNMTIPSETLEFMKNSSLNALDQALTIPVVSQRSELLLAYHRYLTEELSLDLKEIWVDEHLKANNCG